MIFTTKNKELAIFGNTVTDVKKKWKEFKKELAKNNGKLFGENGAFASLFSGQKLNNILTPEVLKQFDDFKEKFNSSSLSAEALAEQMDNVDQKIIDYVKTCKNVEMTTEGFKASIDTMSFSAKAGKVALQALAMAGNMAAMFLVSKSVSAAVSWINSYVNAASKAKEASQALTQEMKKFNADIGKSAKTISSLDSRYQELSGHMNRLGENVSASTNQYEEYKEIISQISSIMPELSVRFNSQGEAIGFTEGKLKDLTKTYEEYRKKAARDFLAKGDGNGNTVDNIVAHYNNQTTAKWYDDLWNRLATKKYIKQTKLY